MNVMSVSRPTLTVGRAPAVKAPAQGAVQTGAKVVGAAAGTVGGVGLGAMLGWIAWFGFNAAGRALSSNVIGIGALALGALLGYVGWKNGGTFGKAIEDSFK